MTFLSKTRFAGAAVVAGLSAAAMTPAADALVVASGPDGLQMREPNNVLNRVHLSLVDDGGLKYRVEMPQFGGRGIEFGPGCRQISDRQGVDVALCDRINPIVSQVSLGPLDDTFTADPAFPDPIHIQDGGIGADRFSLGAGNDVATARDGDVVLGNGGADRLTSLGGRVEGGDGDDVMLALPETIGGLLIGGPGTDSYDAQGGQTVIDSRDGLPEPVRCGTAPRRTGAATIIDLVDTPGDAELVAGGCRIVDRAPRAERTAAQLATPRVTLRGGMASVRVRCTTSARCAGSVALTTGGRTATARFAIAGHRTQTVRLPARGGSAAVQLTERGQAGARTVRSTVRVAS